MKETKTLACPDCNCTTHLRIERESTPDSPDSYMVVCQKCRSYIFGCSTETKAIKQWNTWAGGRQPEPSATAEPSTSASAICWATDYDQPTPETEAFMSRIDDSEIDLGQVKAALRDMECERNSARAEVLKSKSPNGEICQVRQTK